MANYSYSNLQIKTSNAVAIRDALDICDIGSAKLLARSDSEWVSVYPFLTEDDFAYLKIVAEKISARLEVPVFGFLVPNAAEFKYVVYQNGRLLDEFHSLSATAGSKRTAKGGDPDLLLPFCKDGTKKQQLKMLLRPGQTSTPDQKAGDRMAQQFAELLGIPRVQICTGFNHLKWAQAGR